MSTAHVFISGFVQGVGYRAFIKKHAQELGLSGWVKNLPDGHVEALFQGDKKMIEDMITLCKNGPFVSQVDSVDTVWEPVDKDKAVTDFQILRD